MIRVGGGLTFLLFAALAVFLGVSRLDAHVRQELVDRASPTLSFTDLPAPIVGLAQSDLDRALADLLLQDWTADQLCRDMAQRLTGVSWVAEVNHVRRHGDGQFAISCRYRVPFAMAQKGAEFFLVDREGVRLQGTYRYDPAWPLIQGASAAAPAPGKPWPGEDVQATLAIIKALANRPFRYQITAVLVDNFNGRRDPRHSHIELATDRAGGRIQWGSAPGRELEENTVEQKLAILEANYQQTGRVDAHHAVIDVSTFPDRFTIPG